MPYNKGKIVCLGDSITWGFPYGPHQSWVRMLAEVYPGEVINKGLNGDTTSWMLSRFDRAVLPNHPTHVIIMGGTNDVIWQESLDRITMNFRTMVNRCQDHHIKAILGLPAPIDEEEMEKRLERLRFWIKDYARGNDLKIIDFYSAFIDEQGNLRQDLFLADGAHPNQDGYQAMFAQIDLGVFSD